MERIKKYEKQIKELEEKIKKRKKSKAFKPVRIEDLTFKHFKFEGFAQGVFYINAVFTDGERLYEFECMSEFFDGKPMLFARTKEDVVISDFNLISEVVTNLIKENYKSFDLQYMFLLRNQIDLKEYFE